MSYVKSYVSRVTTESTFENVLPVGLGEKAVPAGDSRYVAPELADPKAFDRLLCVQQAVVSPLRPIP
jgi:hypothetical protein